MTTNYTLEILEERNNFTLYITDILKEIKDHYLNLVSTQRYCHKWLTCLIQYISDSPDYQIKNLTPDKIMPYTLQLMSIVTACRKELSKDFSTIVKTIKIDHAEFQKVIGCCNLTSKDLLEMYGSDWYYLQSHITDLSKLLDNDVELTSQIFQFDYDYAEVFLDDAIKKKISVNDFLNDVDIPKVYKENIDKSCTSSTMLIPLPCRSNLHLQFPNDEVIILRTMQLCVIEPYT
jgi:hypothetical protein